MTEENKKEVIPDDNYETPLLEKEEGLVFPEEVIKEFNGSRFCLQCSSCHGCR